MLFHLNSLSAYQNWFCIAKSDGGRCLQLYLTALTNSVVVWILFKKQKFVWPDFSILFQNQKICKNLNWNLKQYLNCTEQPVSSPRSLYALHSRDLRSSGSRTCMSTQWGQIISEIIRLKTNQTMTALQIPGVQGV